MPQVLHKRLLVSLVAFTLSGCGTPSTVNVEHRADIEPEIEMCASVMSFVRAPLGEDGARRAWFLPFGISEGGYVDIYAPMGSNPSDDYSRAFYRNGVGQLTHYQLMPRFAATVTDCLLEDESFTREHFTAPGSSFRATYRDANTNRRIEVSATELRSAFLVVAGDWNGDVAAEFAEMLDLDSETQD